MKKSTKESMTVLGLKLPEGWSADPDGSYAYTKDGHLVIFGLSKDFEITIALGAPDDFTIPYAVLMAMYLDAGVYALKAEEVNYLKVLQDRNEVLTSKLNDQLKELHQLKQAEPRWRLQNAKRAVHFWALKEAREIIVKLGARIHRIRVKNKQLKQEKLDLIDHASQLEAERDHIKGELELARDQLAIHKAF